MKTRLDLYLSAHAAAVALLDGPDPLATDKAAAASFEKDGGAPADWTDWKQIFADRQRAMRAYGRVPLESVRPPKPQRPAPPAKPAAPAAAAVAKAAAVLAVLACLLLAPRAGAGVITNLVGNGAVTVNGTNLSGLVAYTTVAPPGGTYTFGWAQLTATNQVAFWVDVTLDGTNFVPVMVYYPRTTNSSTVTVGGLGGGGTNSAVYFRARTVTTSSTAVSVGYNQP